VSRTGDSVRGGQHRFVAGRVPFRAGRPSPPLGVAFGAVGRCV